MAHLLLCGRKRDREKKKKKKKKREKERKTDRQTDRQRQRQRLDRDNDRDRTIFEVCAEEVKQLMSEHDAEVRNNRLDNVKEWTNVIL